MTAAEFIAAFPAFKDVDAGEITRVLNAAAPDFDVDRWGNLYTKGLGYYVAHMLQLEAEQKAAGAGGILAMDATGKTVGDESITRDAATIERQAKDPFQLSVYGTLYRYYARQVGAGGLAP